MIGETCVEKALLDLGASVNLLPYSVYKQLGLGELKPTSITLSLADRSVKIPRGMIEDVLVQVDKFYYPVDFVVLDTDLLTFGNMTLELNIFYMSINNSIREKKKDQKEKEEILLLFNEEETQEAVKEDPKAYSKAITHGVEVCIPGGEQAEPCCYFFISYHYSGGLST
ncbi:hypothetical protein CK203_061647 [Vitis vinifera]|uniref:Aspartic peptidase DDI1-type domain-containing protein n=1 Tax=Vitis vinifera TaxID=29760 RepID=A0A438FQI6_VITVI|nr:hypothetical protein CK203_061647 [Vitis vinifera]